MMKSKMESALLLNIGVHIRGILILWLDIQNKIHLKMNIYKTFHLNKKENSYTAV